MRTSYHTMTLVKASKSTILGLIEDWIGHNSFHLHSTTDSIPIVAVRHTRFPGLTDHQTGSKMSIIIHELKRIRRSFNMLADATYSASGDIAALVRCKGQTKEMGTAVVQSAGSKHELHAQLLNAKSVSDAIDILRTKLKLHKEALV